jgi:hypothetical protein
VIKALSRFAVNPKKGGRASGFLHEMTKPAFVMSYADIFIWVFHPKPKEEFYGKSFSVL